MKIIFTAFQMIFFASLLMGQTINIPDANFLNALTNTNCVDTDGNGSGDQDADTNNDGLIQQVEADAVTRLTIENQSIADLTGINSFNNLVWLNCDRNDMTILVLTNKPDLEEIVFASNRQLEHVTITGNPKLTALNLRGGNNPFTYGLTNLITFDCSNNALTDLLIYTDGFDGMRIRNLNCANNALTNLTFRSFALVDTLDCSNNNLDQDNLIYSSTPEYQYWDLSNNNFTIVDYQDQEKVLSFIDYSGNPVEVLKIPIWKSPLFIEGNNTIQEIDFYQPGNHVTSRPLQLHLRDLSALNKFRLNESEPIEIFLTNLPNIDADINAIDGDLFLFEFEDLSNFKTSELKTVSIQNCENLERYSSLFRCKELYFFNNPDLKYLEIIMANHNINNSPPFDSLHISGAPLLDSLILHGQFSWNDLPVNLNISDLPQLSYIMLDQQATLSSFQLSNLPSLEKIDFQGRFDKLSLSQLPALKEVIIDIETLEQLEVNNLDQLEYLFVKSEELQELLLIDLPVFQEFNFDLGDGAAQNPMALLQFENLPELQKIDLRRIILEELVLEQLPKLKTFSAHNLNSSTTFSPIGMEYNFIDLPSLDSVYIHEMNVDTLIFDNVPSLRHLSHLENDGSSRLELANLSLQEICFDDGFGDVQELIIKDLPNIKRIKANLRSFDPIVLENVSTLEQLFIGGNYFRTGADVRAYEIKDYPNLDSLVIIYDIDELKISNLPKLKYLDISRNEFDTLVIHDFPVLETFICQFNERATFDFDVSFQDVPSLSHIDFYRSRDIEHLDLSDVPSLNYLELELQGASNSNIDYVNLKNGSEFLEYFFSEEIQYLCVDSKAEFDSLLSAAPELSEASFSDYCSFVPGGAFSTAIGMVTYNTELFDCDDPLVAANEISIQMFSEIENITRFIESDGSYSISTSAIDSTLTIRPSWENDYYTFIPEQYSFDFDSLNQVDTFNFCLDPIGMINDLEIVISPVNRARPGFNSSYKIEYSNKGTTVLSGNLSLDFQDAFMDFLNAAPAESASSAGSLSWDFQNLQPFERKEIELEFELNSPMDTPALLGDDIIVFEVNIDGGVPDEKPEDNTFTLNQTVVNSFDPNDKTCLEGEQISFEMLGDYLHYLIRFENTGSAEAINVVIRDVIDTFAFDINTFVPLNGSHDFVTQIRNGNEVEFIFEGINLPFDDANNDGFVNFKIKPLTSVAVGESLKNDAEIFFDFNFPIITNETNTNVVDDIVLAIKDLNFSARLNNDKVVLLEWSTSNNDQIKLFEIEKSCDGLDFTHLGAKASYGDGFAKSDYSFLDKSLCQTNNYYRLKILESDGSISYSLIRQVNTESPKSMHLFPNPLSVGDDLFIESNFDKAFKLEIFNQIGQLIYSKNIFSRELIKTQAFAPGIYLCKITAGNYKTTRKVVIK